MPVDCGVPVVTNACAFCSTRGRGCNALRVLPHALLLLEGGSHNTSGAFALRERGNVFFFSLAPFLRGEGRVRGSICGLCTRTEPLTRPASLRFAGRALPRAGRGDSKRFALGCLNTESIHVVPDKRAKASAMRDPYAETDIG